MISDEQVVELLVKHQTKYQHRGQEKDWKWSCECGEEKIFETRQLCEMRTRHHLGVLIANLSVDNEPVTPEPETGPEQNIPKDLSIFSYLLSEVDCERMTMPQARQFLGTWFHLGTWPAIPGKEQIEAGRKRMRRLKQIADGLYEEFWSLAGSQR